MTGYPIPTSLPTAPPPERPAAAIEAAERDRDER